MYQKETDSARSPYSRSHTRTHETAPFHYIIIFESFGQHF